MSRKHDFYTFISGLTRQNKINKTRIRAIYIFKLLYRVLHERSNVIASFAEHLKFQEKMTFKEVFVVKRGKIKQKK